MKKYLLLIAIISTFSYSIEFDGELTSGFSATWGGEGIGYGFEKLPNILNVAFPRDNIFDERGATIPDFSSGNNTGSGTSDNNNNNEKPKKNKKPNIYVPSGEKKDIELSKRYVSRGVTFDKTLFDGKINIKDNEKKLATFGLILKGRPHRIDQSFNLFDINRAYLYTKVNTDKLKLNATTYFKGYENGTPGLNKFSEDGERDPKVNGQIDADGTISPFKYITPEIDFNYQGTLANSFNYGINPGIRVSADLGDTNISFATKYVIKSNNENRILDNFVRDIKVMTPGNNKVEYFKKWEIGELELDKEYNKDQTIKGKDGYAAYRYIGKRDIKNGTVTGLNGSIRAVGQYTGALYGQTVVERALKMVVETAMDNLEKGSALDNLSKEFKNLVFNKHNNNGWELFKAFVRRGISGDLGKIESEINKILENKNGELDKITSSVVKEVFNTMDEDRDWSKPVSDYFATHYIPREFRSYLGNALPPIPYEDSEANKKRRETYPEEGDVIIGEDPNKKKENVDVIAPKPTVTPVYRYKSNPNKEKMLGSNAENKGIMTVYDDSRLAIFNEEFKGVLSSISKIIKQIANEKGIGKNIRIARTGMAIFRELLSSNNSNPLLIGVFNKPETLKTFDMFAGLQVNESEAHFRDKEYSKLLLNTYLIDLYSAYKKDSGYERDLNRKDIINGIELEARIKNEKQGWDLTLKANKTKFEEKEILTKKIAIDRAPYTSPLTDLKKEHFLDYIVNKIGDKELYHKKYNIDTQITTNAKENKFNVETNFNYDKNNQKINIGLNYINRDISFNSIEVDKVKYRYHNRGTIDGLTWDSLIPAKRENDVTFITKTDINYRVHELYPSVMYSNKIKVNKFLDIEPVLTWFGKYRYLDYKKISATRYVEGSNADIEAKELEIEVFKRDKDNNLIKAENVPNTGNAEFDNIKAGESVDISKFSKYLFEDIEKTFAKEKSKGKSRWDNFENQVSLGVNLWVYPVQKVKIGYHLLIPVIIKNKNIDGFFIRNGLSLTYMF